MESTSDVIERLRNHANLGSGPDDDSILYAIFRAERERRVPELGRHVDDIIQCLTVVNTELNGPNPSASELASRDSELVARATIPISGILEGVIDYCARMASEESPTALRSALNAAQQICLAWQFVLDGDIDDLSGEIEMNLALRAKDARAED